MPYASKRDIQLVSSLIDSDHTLLCPALHHPRHHQGHELANCTAATEIQEAWARILNLIEPPDFEGAKKKIRQAVKDAKFPYRVTILETYFFELGDYLEVKALKVPEDRRVEATSQLNDIICSVDKGEVVAIGTV